jgi:hypothetical protein
MPSPSGPNYVTSDDLCYKALKNLGVTSSGQAVDPEDFQFVQEEVQAMFNELAGLEIAYIPQNDSIPAALFRPLSDILTGFCAPKFGANTDDQIKWITLGLGGPPSQVQLGGGAAALSLKQQLRLRPTYEFVRTFYI